VLDARTGYIDGILDYLSVQDGGYEAVVILEYIRLAGLTDCAMIMEQFT